MSGTLLPIGYGLLVWWASTGVALLIVGRSGERGRGSLALAAGLSAVSLAALWATRDDASAFGAYAAFTAAILVWGAQEIAFLTGWITGPWRAACPTGVGRWERTVYAVRAVIWHELALAAAGLGVLAATAGGANPVGAWTYGVLFAMRISAKLNVFLGVPNITENFLPAHLAHLKSFFGRASMNGLFPVSVTASTVALVLLAQAVAGAEGAAATGLLLLATLVALGLIEHWFLVLPLPVEALWAWGLSGEDPSPAESPEPVAPPVAGATVVRFDTHPAVRSAPPSCSPARPGPRAVPEARLIATRTEKGQGGRP